MKKPSFLQGALVGFAIALGGAALFSTLRLFVPAATALVAMMPVVAAVYVAYLMWRSDVRTGRFATFVLWSASALAIGLLVESVALAFVLHASLVWLVRSLYFHNGVLPALADLGLSALAVCAAVGTAMHSHSPMLSIWTYFLIQALFVAIPESLATPQPDVSEDTTPFRRAQRTAESALRRLVTH